MNWRDGALLSQNSDNIGLYIDFCPLQEYNMSLVRRTLSVICHKWVFWVVYCIILHKSQSWSQESGDEKRY